MENVNDARPRRPRTLSYGVPTLFVLLFFSLVTTTACDDAELIEQGGGGAPDPVLQQDPLKSRVSVDGLAALFKVAHPAGIDANASTREHRLDGRELTLGPISQDIELSATDVSTDNSKLQVTMTADQPTVTVPVRVDDGASVRICRFQVSDDQIRARADATPAPNHAWSFELAGAPELLTSAQSVDPVASCPPLVDGQGEPDQQLENWLRSYVETATRQGIRDYLAISLLDELGLPSGSTALRHLSPFANRRGVLRFADYPARGESTELDSAGTTLRLDVGLSAKRAGCAPHAALKSPEDDSAAGEITPADLRDSEADVGLAFSRSLLTRLTRATTLGGFLCRGLDTNGLPDTRSLSRHEARLESAGLGHIPANGPLESVISPGKLPTLSFQARQETIELSWRDLTVELYGIVAGTRTRLLSLTSSAVFQLRPSDASRRQLELTLETIEVDETTLETPWLQAPPNPHPSDWARRLLLLVFEDAFSLPLPLTPGTPLELIDTDIRPDDLLLRLDVRTR